LQLQLRLLWLVMEEDRMKIYISRSRFMSQAQAYAIKLYIDAKKQEVQAVIGTQLRRVEDQPAAFSVDGVDYFDISSMVIRVSELRASRNWSGRQVFSCAYDWKLGRWLAPFPQYVYSRPFRFTAYEMNQMFKVGQENSLIAFNVPFADSAFADCFLTVNLHPTLGGIVVDGDASSDILDLGYDHHDETREMVFPSVHVSAPLVAQVGQPLTFSLQVVDGAGHPLPHDAEIHLEAVNGYCPKPRVRTHQGTAHAVVLPLGLEAGDVVRLKAGFKFFPALGEAQVTLTQ